MHAEDSKHGDQDHPGNTSTTKKPAPVDSSMNGTQKPKGMLSDILSQPGHSLALG